MSLTNQIRIGFFALAALVAAVAILAIEHSNRSIEAIDINLSTITPTQIGLKQIDALLSEAGLAFVKYDQRERTTATDSLDLLTRLVAAEKTLIAYRSVSAMVPEIRQRLANRARIAFYFYLDEIEVDRSGDTAIGLKHDVNTALREFRRLLIDRETEFEMSGIGIEKLRQTSNLLDVSEITLQRYFQRSAVDFPMVMEPVVEAMALLDNLPLDALAQVRVLVGGDDLSHIIDDIDFIRRPVRIVRGALFSYKDAEDAEITGTAQEEVRLAAGSRHC